MTIIMRYRPATLLVCLTLVLSLLPLSAFAAMQRSRGQTVYLPVIPQVEAEGRRKPTYLRYWMILRNTDLKHDVTVRDITYHNSQGKVEKMILDKPLTLKPLASHALRFKEQELAIAEGMSACMIIHWEAAKAVSPLMVDGAVIGSGTGWSTGMLVKGVVIEER